MASEATPERGLSEKNLLKIVLLIHLFLRPCPPLSSFPTYEQKPKVQVDIGLGRGLLKGTRCPGPVAKPLCLCRAESCSGLLSPTSQGSAKPRHTKWMHSPSSSRLSLTSFPASRVEKAVLLNASGLLQAGMDPELLETARRRRREWKGAPTRFFGGT